MQLRSYLQTLQRGWWIVALTTLAALILSLAASYRATPVYRASARFIITPNSNQGAVSRDIVNSLSALDKRTIASTFAEVLDSASVYNDAGKDLQLDPDKLRSYTISTVVLPDANILQLSVTGTDPRVVASLANSVGQKGIDYVSKLYQVYTISALDPAVMPTAPISPNPQRDASLALVLGAVLGAVLVSLREHFSSSFTKLGRHSNIDTASLAYTRSYIVQQFEKLAQQPGAEASLALFHFDGLQQANGSLPKPAFQSVLQRITVALRDELRGNDLVGRWNDTSFAVLLSGLTGPTAAQTVERIRQVLSKPLVSDLNGDAISLSPRVGLGEYRGAEPTDDVISRAEKALEQARKAADKTAQLSKEMKTVSA